MTDSVIVKTGKAYAANAFVTLGGLRGIAVPAVLVALLASCTAIGPERPRSEYDRWATEAQHYEPVTYRVRHGDTLSTIAWRYRLDERELASWNRLRAPYRLIPGQQILLDPPAAFAQANPPRQVVRQQVPQPVQQQVIRRSPVVQQQRPATVVRRAPAAVMAPIPVPVPLKPTPANAPKQAARPSVKPKAAKPATPAKVAKATPLKWQWPARGKVKSAPSGQAGINIEGRSGQPILAAAPGKVVYSGNGLKGYGELIIIKHSDSLLSAYAHNRRRLIEEGSDVRQGQRIAEMGQVSGENPYLYFEIRKNGQPVNPIAYLPVARN